MLEKAQSSVLGFFFNKEVGVQLLISILLLTSLVVVYLVLEPGVYGSFVLDDLSNLVIIKTFSTNTFLENLYTYVNSGHPLFGRWLTYFSFALDDVSWPSSPFRFKMNNLLIHLLNGVLIFKFASLILNIDKINKNNTQIYLLSLMVLTLWLLHPMLQSTYFYVIQRMTLLMASFVLVGLIFYIWGRVTQELSTKVRYLLIVLGLFGLGFLAASSKENGVLIFVYALSIESYINSKGVKAPLGWCKVKHLLLTIPAMGIVVALLYYAANGNEAMRDFNVLERFLTQPSIVFKYLHDIVFPTLSGYGLYHDDQEIIYSIQDPQAYVYIILLITLVGFSFIKRKKYPILFFMVSFFLAGHLIESSVILLELYFEHRNYLPLLAFPMGLAMYIQKSDKYKKYLYATGISYILLLGFIQVNTAKIWSNDWLLFNLWRIEHPNSVRAAIKVAELHLGRNEVSKSRELLKGQLKRNPDSSSIKLSLFIVECAETDKKNTNSLGAIEQLAESGKFTWQASKFLESSYQKMKGGCYQLSNKQIIKLGTLFVNNPSYKNTVVRGNIMYLISSIYESEGKYSESIEMLDKLYVIRREPAIAYKQAILSLKKGDVELAKKYLIKSRIGNTKKLGFLVKEEHDSSHLLEVIGQLEDEHRK